MCVCVIRLKNRVHKPHSLRFKTLKRVKPIIPSLQAVCLVLLAFIYSRLLDSFEKPSTLEGDVEEKKKNTPAPLAL